MEQDEFINELKRIKKLDVSMPQHQERLWCQISGVYASTQNQRHPIRVLGDMHWVRLVVASSFTFLIITGAYLAFTFNDLSIDRNKVLNAVITSPILEKVISPGDSIVTASLTRIMGNQSEVTINLSQGTTLIATADKNGNIESITTTGYAIPNERTILVVGELTAVERSTALDIASKDQRVIDLLAKGGHITVVSAAERYAATYNPSTSGWIVTKTERTAKVAVQVDERTAVVFVVNFEKGYLEPFMLYPSPPMTIPGFTISLTDATISFTK